MKIQFFNAWEINCIGLDIHNTEGGLVDTHVLTLEEAKEVFAQLGSAISSYEAIEKDIGRFERECKLKEAKLKLQEETETTTDKDIKAGTQYLVSNARGYHIEDGVRYYDNTMQQWYLADEDDLAILGELLSQQKPMPYYNWCARTPPTPARAKHRLGGDVATAEDNQRFIPLHDEAIPTNAVCEHPDFEEWCQYGEIDGMRCTLYWVFDGAPDWPADDEAADRIVWEEH